MRQAIDETERRRTKQIEYNETHGITPVSIHKSVTDILDMPTPTPGRSKAAQIAEQAAEYKVRTPAEATKQIKDLEKRMYEHAKELEFEQAGMLRDEIQQIQEEMMR